MTITLRGASMLAALLVMAFASLANAADEIGDTDPFARDLLILTEWFEGQFDNEEQRWFQADPRSATAEEDRQLRLHVMHRRLDLPAFGDHVFYVEEYKDNDPENLVRQRFVIFSSDREEGAIRMKQGFFRNTEKARGAQFDPDKLKNLRQRDVFFIDECDVFWRRVADQYEGSMKPKACVFGEGAERRYSVHDMVLSKNKYWRVDSTFLVSDDSLHIGYPVDRPIKMRRSKIFLCEVSIRNADGAPQAMKGLRLHSQGGTISFMRDSDGQDFTVMLRDKEYPYYETRPDFLYFSLRKTGERRSVLYTVSDADSRRIGFNHDGMGVHCHREGYEFRQTLDQL